MLLLAAAQQTGLLDALVAATMELVEPTIPGLSSPNPAVVTRLILTLLFLPVSGLARTWDLRSYTGTMLAVVTLFPKDERDDKLAEIKAKYAVDHRSKKNTPDTHLPRSRTV